MALKEGVDREIDWLLTKEYIRESQSTWASPVVMVKKPNGQIRLCVDFKHINEVTKPLPFYMPQVEDVLEAVGRSSVISKLDLSKGYYQVPMASKVIMKTAICCHCGKYEFVRMPFGVKNAPAVFQTLISKVLIGCSEFSHPYMDDIIIFSSSWELHKVHIRKVLSCLRTAELTANPEKCSWGKVYMNFLGHHVGNGCMSIPERRAEVFRTYSKPVTKWELRSFLGAVSFYRRYVEINVRDSYPVACNGEGSTNEG